MLSIVFPLSWIVFNIDLVMDILLLLPFIPIYLISIRAIQFLWDKQSARFSEEINQAQIKISNALETEGYSIQITPLKHFLPQLAFYNTLIMIQDNNTQINMYLKGIKIVSLPEFGSKESFFTQIYIGPISSSNMRIIHFIQSTLDKELKI